MGDAPEDIEMGKRAGVFTIGVVSEYVHRSRLEAAAPDLLLETIADLPAVARPYREFRYAIRSDICGAVNRGHASFFCFISSSICGP